LELDFGLSLLQGVAHDDSTENFDEPSGTQSQVRREIAQFHRPVTRFQPPQSLRHRPMRGTGRADTIAEHALKFQDLLPWSRSSDKSFSEFDDETAPDVFQRHLSFGELMGGNLGQVTQPSGSQVNAHDFGLLSGVNDLHPGSRTGDQGTGLDLRGLEGLEVISAKGIL